MSQAFQISCISAESKLRIGSEKAKESKGVECNMEFYEFTDFFYESNVSIGTPRCSVTWDGVMCWGPAVPGTTVYTSCPPAKGMDTTREFSIIFFDNKLLT